MDKSKARPDICIGTDLFHTLLFLSDALIAAVKELNFSVAVNVPFAGALVSWVKRRTSLRPREMSANNPGCVKKRKNLKCRENCLDNASLASN